MALEQPEHRGVGLAIPPGQVLHQLPDRQRPVLPEHPQDRELPLRDRQIPSARPSRGPPDVTPRTRNVRIIAYARHGVKAEAAVVFDDAGQHIVDVRVVSEITYPRVQGS